jgi:hypothetical protein
MRMETDEEGKEQPKPILDEPQDYRVPYFGLFEPTDEGTPLPSAYLFPRGLIEIQAKLRQHGIKTEEIPGPLSARVSAFQIEEIQAEDRLFQGHRITTLKGKWEEQEVPFPGGAWRVPCDQPLARLAAYLLEPESDDGLAAWNFFDRYLIRGQWDPRPGTYPVMKVP